MSLLQLALCSFVLRVVFDHESVTNETIFVLSFSGSLESCFLVFSEILFFIQHDRSDDGFRNEAYKMFHPRVTLS